MAKSTSSALRRHYLRIAAWDLVVLGPPVAVTAWLSLLAWQAMGWWWLLVAGPIGLTAWVLYRRLKRPRYKRVKTADPQGQRPPPPEYGYRRHVWYFWRGIITATIFEMAAVWLAGQFVSDVLSALVTWAAVMVCGAWYMRRCYLVLAKRDYEYGAERPFTITEYERWRYGLFGGASDKFVMSEMKSLISPNRSLLERIFDTQSMIVTDVLGHVRVVTDIRFYWVIEQIFDWQHSAAVRDAAQSKENAVQTKRLADLTEEQVRLARAAEERRQQLDHRPPGNIWGRP